MCDGLQSANNFKVFVEVVTSFDTEIKRFFKNASVIFAKICRQNALIGCLKVLLIHFCHKWSMIIHFFFCGVGDGSNVRCVKQDEKVTLKSEQICQQTELKLTFKPTQIFAQFSF